MLKAHGCDLVDVSAGQTSAEAKPQYGRMFQTPFADAIRQEAGIATIAIGAITSADQVNTILAAGRADLCALARSEEHTSELQSLMRISYAVFCLKKKKHSQHT